jgi:hypothetical protein
MKRMRDPESALAEQIALYRRMSGEERLAIALRLHELACDVAREGIRAQHPDADDEEVERRLRLRISLAHGNPGSR